MAFMYSLFYFYLYKL